ncbi:MAG: glutamine amidotransferase [Desulfobacteraceae bacterium]|nr:glutamine amidotransferase [Desulfobacteraceae bacterium]
MKQQNVYFFVFDSLSDWEAGYAIAAINNPQFQLSPDRYQIRTVSLRQGPVMTIGGVRIDPDLTLENISYADSAMLILPGGTAWDSGQNMEAVEVAAQFLSAGVPVAAICGATVGLARAGLLDDRRHTSNAKQYLAATQYCGVSLYEESPAVTDANLITASGLAPVDFAQHIFQRLNLYSPKVLDAWYGLFKTGKPEFFGALMQAFDA